MKNFKRIAALALAMAVAGTSVSQVTFANTVETTHTEVAEKEYVIGETKLDRTGYNSVFEENFDGDSLNMDVWNIEAHQPGWVNSEWQEYVDAEHASENIVVSGNALNIIPKRIAVQEGNMFTNADFSDGKNGWSETDPSWTDNSGVTAESSIGDGKITYAITHPGTEGWHVQLKQELSLEKTKKYKVTFEVESNAKRTIQAGVQITKEPYSSLSTGVDTFGDSDNTFSLKAGEKKTITINVNDKNQITEDQTGAFYISMGKTAEDTPDASTIEISNLMFTELDANGNPVAKTEYKYTSGRINTQDKKTFTYGLFECRAKVPVGQGYLPAFWLMANDENVYGQWPRCGEIDCMEVMGQEPNKLYGTIHYGNPHGESQGTKVLDTGSFADDYHLFQCEWLPGRINWYVDGVLYHTENDWHSTTEGKGTLTYPAPFDQPFYIILNLAIGGSWVGNPNETTSFENQAYSIDYVKVYQKDSYDENVTKPEKTENWREPVNGNYVLNGDFASADFVGVVDKKDDWTFKTANGGEATCSVNNKELTVNTTNDGTVDYSVQLLQAGVPLKKTAQYKVSFKAKVSEARTIGVAVKGGEDRGWEAYFSKGDVALNTNFQTYEYTFTMDKASNANARFEFNMGNAGSTATINIKDVKLEMVKAPDPDADSKKTVLADGNYIYNGQFQEGDKHLGEWTVDNKSEASVSVTGFADGRRLKVVAGEASKASDVTLTQKDLAFNEGGAYEVSFDAQAEKGTTKEVSIIVGGKKFTANVTDEKKNFKFKIKSTDAFTNKDVILELGTPGTVYVDNVRMVEDSLIKNGSFNAGMSGYDFYADSSASATSVVDSLKEDNALDITVNKTGDADWKVQVKQNNVPLEKGKKYKLSFKAKSSLPRKIRVVMQGLENKGWPVYSSDPEIALTENYQTFTEIFTMEKDTDPNAFLSICLGKIDAEINDQHRVVIDDISLEEVVEETQKPGDSGNGGTTTPSNPGTSTTPTTPSTPTESDKPAQGDKPAEGEKPAEEGKENKVVTKVEVTEKNTTAEVIKSTDSKGNTTVEANLVTTTAPNKKGEVTVQISNETLKKLVAEAGTNKVTVSQKLVDDDGKTICKVKMNVADVKPGKTLSVVKYDSKTKSYTLVDVDPVKVSKDGSIKLTTDETGTLKLMNSTDTKKFVQKILDSVKVTKKSDTVKKGKTTKVSLSKSLNTKNVKKITYSSSKSAVAKVDANGKVVAKKAGTATIKATVTLQNGKKKTVSMKIKVK